ncbi:cupin domain-containing protein [Kitasatospora mediocidica]|uniref:cupin domain-containing protein n=1 Tax=Kitasatospora mediocidica TaxID=58352 RepID=UPI00068E3040|nr:cupin domain-containing protein [Kitasatospora mediocidica]
MPIQSGSRFPYPDFKKRYDTERQEPVVWRWAELAQDLGSADHPERGTLALSLPDGSAEIVRDTAVAYQVVPAEGRTTAHAHSWYHLFVVRSGTGTVVFEPAGERTELNPGDIMLVPAWSLHRFENPGAQGDLVLLNLMNIPLLSQLGNLFSEQGADQLPDQLPDRGESARAA